VLDEELPQSCVTGETAAAAVAKFRADLADVISRDLDAAQSAMGLCARSAVVDQNEAEHIAPPPGKRFPRHNAARFQRRLADRDSFSSAAIPVIAA
jgi:hypothetical protein